MKTMMKPLQYCTDSNMKTRELRLATCESVWEPWGKRAGVAHTSASSNWLSMQSALLMNLAFEDRSEPKTVLLTKPCLSQPR